MDNYQQTLEAMAEKLSLTPELLHSYLHNTISPTKKAMLAASNQIEGFLTGEGDGVFYCLIKKSESVPQTLVTSVEYVAPLLRGIYKVCVESGCDVQYFATNDDLATEEYFRTILSQNPDAGVLLMIPRRTKTVASVCMEMNRPCIMIDYPNRENLPIYTLNIDNSNAVYSMTRKLIELGHKRIAILNGRRDIASALERYSGYKDALEDADLPYEDLVRYGNWRIDTGQALTEELLALPDPPTAIICTNDLSALGAYTAIKSAGLRIPHDISVVGFDGIPIVATIDPPLTTVRQPLESMGRTAASLLIDVLEGNPPTTFRHEHALEMLWRESIGPARS